MRFPLGLGKLPDDALVYPKLDGSPQSPRAFSKDWVDAQTAGRVKARADAFTLTRSWTFQSASARYRVIRRDAQRHDAESD
jgi:hypothetical protein